MVVSLRSRLPSISMLPNAPSSSRSADTIWAHVPECRLKLHCGASSSSAVVLSIGVANSMASISSLLPESLVASRPVSAEQISMRFPRFRTQLKPYIFFDMASNMAYGPVAQTVPSRITYAKMAGLPLTFAFLLDERRADFSPVPGFPTLECLTHYL